MNFPVVSACRLHLAKLQAGMPLLDEPTSNDLDINLVRAGKFCWSSGLCDGYLTTVGSRPYRYAHPDYRDEGS